MSGLAVTRTIVLGEGGEAPLAVTVRELTVAEIRAAYDRAAQIEYGVEAIKNSRDLDITKENGQIVIRPMMYLALSYDHRIVDGKGAVTFLVRVKEALEDPRRLLMDL